MILRLQKHHCDGLIKEILSFKIKVETFFYKKNSMGDHHYPKIAIHFLLIGRGKIRFFFLFTKFKLEHKVSL